MATNEFTIFSYNIDGIRSEDTHVKMSRIRMCMDVIANQDAAMGPSKGGRGGRGLPDVILLQECVQDVMQIIYTSLVRIHMYIWPLSCIRRPFLAHL
jgi:hypothetical protein